MCPPQRKVEREMGKGMDGSVGSEQAKQGLEACQVGLEGEEGLVAVG